MQKTSTSLWGETLSEKIVYVAFRVKDMPVPYVPSLKAKCRECGEDVYYSKYVYENAETVRAMISKGDIICLQCSIVLAKKEADETVGAYVK
jgi:formylmethanofuran dehydrogenase subunit E